METLTKLINVILTIFFNASKNKGVQGMNISNNVDFAKKAEGTKRLHNGNHAMYKCSADCWTIGYGRNVQANGISENEAERMLMNDLGDAVRMCEANVSCWSRLSEVRKSVLIDMCFNMGWPRLSRFEMMFIALEGSDYDEAARQIMDSKYWVDVTDNERGQEDANDIDTRAEFLVQSMRTNIWHPYS